MAILNSSIPPEQIIAVTRVDTDGFRFVFSVCSVEMSLKDDTFLSAAVDDTVRFWDLRAQHAQVTTNHQDGRSNLGED